MKQLIYILIFVFSISLVTAIQINDTTLNATGSNTVVKIFEWINVTNITIESNHIVFYNFTKTSYIYNKNTATAVVLVSSGTTDYNFTGTDTTFYVWRNATGLPSPPSPPPSGGGSTSGAEAGADVKAQETATMTEELCLLSEGMSWFKDTCYNCDGKLLEVPTGELKCIKCKEGFKMSKRGSCLIDGATFNFSPMITILTIIIIGFLVISATENREWINRKIFKRQ